MSGILNSNIDFKEFFKNLKPPTEEELQKIANESLDRHHSYSVTQFTNELKNVSLPFYEVQLTINEVLQFVEFENNPEIPESIISKVEKSISDNNLQSGFFIKFMSRSAKDVNHNMSEPYNDVKTSLNDMRNSMRCFDDMCSVAYATENVERICLIIRPFVNFNRGNEFRIFKNQFNQMFVTKYYVELEHTVGYSQIVKQSSKIADMFNLHENFKHIENLVIDVIINDDSDSPTLIEVNPYELSDPICFAKDYDETIKGGFHHNLQDRKTIVRTA